KAEQALLGKLAPDGPAPATLLLHVFLALLKLVGVGEHAVDAVLEQPLLLGQIEIHLFFPDYKFRGDPVLHLSPLAGRGVGLRSNWGEGVLATIFRREALTRPSPSEERGEDQSPSTALLMMLRWISLEPP